MTKRVAVIGAGTIGASWAAIFLARGLEVAAYDPAENGESFLRKFIGNAWPTLRQLNWVLPEADPMRLSFHREVANAVRDAEFIQESGPEREDVKKGAESAFLHRLHKGACGVFGTVLGPEANEAHRDHFHFDLATRRRSALCQ